ncbi:hypothetical protein HB662_20880 [Roseomonas frigidaquae]|uniref:Uncharacterized protein n=1 Tax=Falsiroseomonas frigidaquae TaxID=487318 RepID=A0ABX1F4G4_9PROT|nr:hypothetical protein [Falsiroseomonas frigidaquae]NKE47246.1 hypothetical protein [Falsiroseomonas frigidaquae]
MPRLGWQHLLRGPGPDGYCGNLLVAHTRVGTAWRFLAVTSRAGASTTSRCLGGLGGHDLFISGSETGSILRARLDSA